MELMDMSKDQLISLKSELEEQYNNFKSLKLSLDMSRGKPSKDQLELSMDMMNVLNSDTKLVDENNTDIRNYGILDGIPEAKKLFADLLQVSTDEVIVGGNSSLALMYDTVARAMQFGLYNSEKPWNKYDKVKFLCPVPGYDRHFAISELFGIEMINIPMTGSGPDMDLVDKYVSEDETVKGIWCVPLYSNPEGISYSDEVVKRFAALKPKAKDFTVFWDNAYCVHHLSDDKDNILNIFDECKKLGSEDMVFEFASTSKISFSGSGVSVMAASKNNINYIKKLMGVQIIGFDKINQLRHVRYFKDVKGINEHMKKHAAIMKPKFDTVIKALSEELLPLGIIEFKKPKGGYFISVNTLPGCAKRTEQLCKEAGVVLTPAGVTYPYGKDPKDSNIRIAPTFPPVSELETAVNLFCLCVKLASIEKLLA